MFARALRQACKRVGWTSSPTMNVRTAVYMPDSVLCCEAIAHSSQTPAGCSVPGMQLCRRIYRHPEPSSQSAPTLCLSTAVYMPE